VIEPKYVKRIYQAVIELMKFHTKKEMDDLWADVLRETLVYFT